MSLRIDTIHSVLATYSIPTVQLLAIALAVLGTVDSPVFRLPYYIVPSILLLALFATLDYQPIELVEL